MVGPLTNRKIPSHHFFNKDLEYLIHGNTEEKKYALSLTKLPAALYIQDEIEEQINNLSSFYKARKAFVAREKVDSKCKIMKMTNVEVGRMHGYGFLTRIDFNIADRKIYTFIESIYSNLSLNDINDLYLLKVQGKLHHLSREAEYDLTNSLMIFIRSVVIKKRVEDVQLGDEIYQQKLNLTKPDNKDGGNRFMGINEVFNFGDGTIMKVKEELKAMLTDMDV
ncbi:hypothetical protein Tco_1328984 [Tanacetum coccineum]